MAGANGRDPRHPVTINGHDYAIVEPCPPDAVVEGSFTLSFPSPHTDQPVRLTVEFSSDLDGVPFTIAHLHRLITRLGAFD